MSGADEYTPAETGRAFVDIKATLGQVLDELKDMRRDSVTQFAALEDKYVLQQVWSATLQTLHNRQDDYQHQTDRIFLGSEEEIQQVRREITGLKADMQRVADQRHSDRVAYSLAFIALAGGLAAALLPGWIS